ncbi:hypothetical protein G7050_09705 [Dysgonomonas sp. HDW5A]|uniref:cysteine peptidase family C39 domain-containing protein n=1 Tax=unclassified Dysgonomonas TaxID=2630389 RepID=UPI00140871F9|nr:MULTISPECIES: cysteine peptidase family C39 domain-containing protein [unclassified Dysgonomonas]QIK54666.1 hypothetical protein G7051_10040 [Dysgonomonas sp. HDW5B]QIK60092.1 hypothetical protein G7050_09705 [Dysgonomonas sp. HDW5A]
MNVRSTYMVNLVSTYLSLCNVVHNRKVIGVQLDFEQKDSSILAISNILKDYDLHCKTYYSDFDTLKKDKRKGILHLRIDGGRYVVLKSLGSEGNVVFYDPVINKNIEISKFAFQKLWSSIVIYSDVMPSLNEHEVSKEWVAKKSVQD